ncbi:hypothetical protein CW711_06755 [Candidatus Bathyarchaeota archaeon]|nr:MAG: hypothetical protein B6U84_03560 [Candidatus Bathyarchaeota archaeon ex4484_40]RJS77376.1 MAG: hypothetical protein CW711_06755 [Candidatus Bathyarchaeota archaeon]
MERFYAGKFFLSKPVEHYLVGAMTPEVALRCFRRAKRKTVVTGGNRLDIALEVSIGVGWPFRRVTVALRLLLPQEL